MNPLLRDRFPRDVHTDPHDPNNESHRMARELRDRRHADIAGRTWPGLERWARCIGCVLRRRDDGQFVVTRTVHYHPHSDTIIYHHVQNPH